MDKVANSTDIAELVKEFGQNQAALAGMVKSSLDSLKTFASIKIDKKVKDSLKKMKDVKSTFNTYSSAVSDMIDGISNLLPKNASPDELSATLSVLSGDPKKTTDLFNDAGKKIASESIDEKRGILDIIGVTLGLIKQIAEVQPPNKRKLNNTIRSYSDTVTMLWSFVRTFGDSADPAAAMKSSMAAKTITDAMLNLTGIFSGIQKDLIPMTELVSTFEPSIKRGMTLLYDPEADPDKQFSIISTVVGAATQAAKVDGEKVKQLGTLGDSVNKAAKSMSVGLGLLGITKVSEKVTDGTKTLKKVIYDIIECSNLAAGIDPNDMKNLAASVSAIEKTVEITSSLYVRIFKAAAIAKAFRGISGSEPFAWLSEMIGMIKVPAPSEDSMKNAKDAEKITALMLASVDHINEISGAVIFAVPRAVTASNVLSWMYDKLRVNLALATSAFDRLETEKIDAVFATLSNTAENLFKFVLLMPSKRKVIKAMESLLVIGEILGDKEVQTQFKEAMAAIDLMAGEKDTLVQLGELLGIVKDTMKNAAGVGLWCALGIPGLLMVSLSARVMEHAVYALMLVVSGFSREEISDASQQFHDIGMMVVWAGVTVAVCALVGALTISALPIIAVGFAAIAAVVLAFVGLMKLIQMAAGGKQFQSNAEAIADLGRLILLAGATVVISILVGLLVLKYLQLILVGFAALMLVTVALVGILWLIGKIGEIPGLKTGMLMFLAMIMSMMLAALLISIVAKVGAGIDMLGILKFVGTLIIIAGIYIGLGLLLAAGGIVAVVLATAGIILIAVSMLLIVGAISAVNKAMEKTDPEKTKENVSGMLDSMKYTMEYVNDNFSIKDMAAAAAKMFLIANMSKHLMRMATRIQKIASLEMDEYDDAGHPTGRKVKMKTQDFIDAAVNGVAVARVIAAILDDTPTQIETSGGTFVVTGLSNELLEKINNKNKRKIRQLSKITKFIGRMATTVADIASLKMETEWGPDGKPTAFKKMTLQDFMDASANGLAIARLMASILDDGKTTIQTSEGSVTVSGLSEDILDKINNKSKRKFRQLNKITTFIGRMTETVAKIASLKIATEWNADGKPISFEAITAEQMKDAALNATAITQFFAAVAANSPQTLHMAGGVELTVEPTSENLFEKVDFQTRRKFRFLEKIVGTIAGATKTVTDTAALRIPTEWNKEGAPIKYEPITAEQMQTAAENVVKIMTTLTDAIVSPEMTAKLDSFDRSQKRAVERMFTAVMPITSMVEAVVALAGGSLEEYDAEGHPTGKQVNVLKALESKPDIINGIVSIYSIFTDALAVITGSEAAAEQAAAPSGGLFGRIASKVAGAVSAVVDAGVSLVKNIQASIDTDTAAKNVTAIIEPITSMIDTVKKLNSAMAEVDMKVGENLALVIGQSVLAVSSIDPEDIVKLGQRISTLDKYADVVKKFMDANKTAQAADNVHRTMEDTGKFVVQLNKVSDTKLAKMASISRNMADFARRINGNFDRLADAMNDKMVTALDKVDKTLKEVNKTMNEMPGKLKTAVSNIKVTGGGTDTVADKSKDDNSKANAPKETGKGSDGKNVTGKTVNNCIVQADDGTFALAVVQKYE